ncbi:MAG TPA: hypothetical protein VHT23_03465 [Gemmatimonadaceae bacterium]|nr:hypothetical protein [Gemmatimonadaceae bacterium]
MTGVLKISKRESKVSVTDANIRKASTRLLKTKLVSTEMSYVRRELGASATQDELDAKILAVRKLPWASIVLPD